MIMGQQAKIRFKDDNFVRANEQLQTFISTNKKELNIVSLESELIDIINVKEEKALTLDKVRMIAGNVSRELGKQKVQQASVKAKDLTASFAALNKDNVLTAFVEGWELGSYQYTAYKSKADHVKTELHIDSDTDIQQFIETGKLRAAAMSFSRDLMNDVPSVLNPETFPKRLKD